jgi:outer membrane immunogenic protein
MNKLLGVLAAFAALVGTSALANDVSAKESPVVAASTYNWSGAYAGLDAGGIWAHSSDPTTVVFFPGGYFAATSVAAIDAAGAQRNNAANFTGGAHVGWNWQWNALVAGLEADLDYVGLKKSSTSSGPYPCCGPTTGFIINSSFSTNWLEMIRGRFGFAGNDWLFYATAGVAFTEFKANFTFTDLCGLNVACAPRFFPYAPGIETASIVNLKPGYVVGGGIETRLAGNWTVKAEYLNVGFGGVTTQGYIGNIAQILIGSNENPLIHSANLTANIVRLGLNYKFGN